jgi:N-acetylmuramoyl-L-alanine amidase
MQNEKYQMKEIASPNFDLRKNGSQIKYVVLHYTGMDTAQDAIERLCSPESKVSAHYLIDEDGTLYHMVDETNRAWHAGQSFWQEEDDINNLSIGIELVNPGHANDYRPFPDPQISTLKTLLRGLFDKYALSPAALLAHSDIAPERKEDPGELFPWKEFAAEGFGLWPAEPHEPAILRLTKAEINEHLRIIGYYCPEESWHAQLSAYIAFLRRYHPERLLGGFDQTSLQRLVSLSSTMKN